MNKHIKPPVGTKVEEPIFHPDAHQHMTAEIHRLAAEMVRLRQGASATAIVATSPAM